METMTVFFLWLASFLFAGGAGTLFGAVSGWMAKDKWGAIPCYDLIAEKVMHFDPRTVKPAEEAGMSLVEQKRGPWGFLSRWTAIPEPFVQRGKDGKALIAFSPKSLFMQRVNGEVDESAFKIATLENEKAELEFRLTEATGFNQEAIEKKVKEVVAHLQHLKEFPSKKNAGWQK